MRDVQGEGTARREVRGGGQAGHGASVHFQCHGEAGGGGAGAAVRLVAWDPRVGAPTEVGGACEGASMQCTHTQASVRHRVVDVGVGSRGSRSRLLGLRPLIWGHEVKVGSRGLRSRL